MARIDQEHLGELLSAYIDGELEARERQVIERVLREDESARQLLADLRRTVQAVSSLPHHAAPGSVATDIQSVFERSALLEDLPEPRAHQTRGRSSWVARLAMAAMVGLVVVTGWWYTVERPQAVPLSVAHRLEPTAGERDASSGKEEGTREPGAEKSSLARASRAKEALATRSPMPSPVSVPVNAGGVTAMATATATVEQQLAAGVDPTALRRQAFAAEPVRLQVTVRDRSEREALVARISAELSKLQLADLAAAPGPHADTTASAQRFYYRGESGVNFEADDEDQILVRASPQQIDRLLTDLAAPGDSVAMVAGPIAVQGVEKSRSVVQLLGEQHVVATRTNEKESADAFFYDKSGAVAEAAPTEKPTAPGGGMMGGLLRIVGIDPKLLSAGAKSAPPSGPAADEAADEVASRDSMLRTTTAVAAAGRAGIDAPAEPGATPSGPPAKGKATPAAAMNAPTLPPSPSPLVERRLREFTESSRESATKDAPRPAGQEVFEGNVTVVVQIIERPKPVQTDKPAKSKSDRSKASKGVQ
ncbi:MAG: zf-HC2 domain-containing protein [Planctomycetota bacterium]